MFVVKFTRNYVFWLLLFSTFSKNGPEYIDHTGHFVFFMRFYVVQLFCQTSPGRCSRGSCGGWKKNKFFTKLVDTYHRNITRKLGLLLY